MYIISMWKNGAPDFIKVNMLLYRIDTCFSFCLEFEQQIDFERFFQQLSCDRLSRKQRFKVRTCPNNKTLVLENMSDGHIRILGNRKKVCCNYNITDFLWNAFLLERKIVWYNHQHYPHIKNGIEWLKYECPSDIINFRCFLLKADFRIFYFELKSFLNKLVKLRSYFFQKLFLNSNAECFIFIKKVNLFSNRPTSI